MAPASGTALQSSTETLHKGHTGRRAISETSFGGHSGPAGVVPLEAVLLPGRKTGYVETWMRPQAAAWDVARAVEPACASGGASDDDETDLVAGRCRHCQRGLWRLLGNRRWRSRCRASTRASRAAPTCYRTRRCGFAPRRRAGKDRYGPGMAGLGSVGWGFGNGLRVEIEGNYRDNTLQHFRGTSFPTIAGGISRTTAPWPTCCSTWISARAGSIRISAWASAMAGRTCDTHYAGTD